MAGLFSIRLFKKTDLKMIAKNKIFKPLGSSNHCIDEREVNDYYATDPKAVDLLLGLDELRIANDIWEPACGQGHISKVLHDAGHKVRSTDLIDRGFGVGGVNFFDCRESWHGDIITNPPYGSGKDFILHALSLLQPGMHLYAFLKLLFVESADRRELFNNYPPKYIFVSSSRLHCAKNGDFNSANSKAVAYAWYVWEKGYQGYTIIKWFN